MNKNIKETIKKELRSIIRDKKSLIMMLLTPLFIPVFILIFSYIYTDIIYSEKTTSSYIGINYTPNSIEKKLISDNNLKTKKFKNKKEMQQAFDDKKIDAYITLENNEYKIYYNEINENSTIASTQIVAYLESYNTYLANNYLTNINANLDLVYNNISYNLKKITSSSNDLVNMIVTFGFIFAIMSITLTAIYCATDIIAGEKERGTLETFLTFPIKSNELIIGKYLGISIACLITSIISITLIIGSLLIAHNMFDIYKNIVFNFNIEVIFLSLLIMFSYSLFISGLSIAIASFSKSYKEAQSMLTPLSFIVMIPMFFEILDIKINNLFSIIPIINHTLLINDIFTGKINIINILLMFLSTIIYIIIIIKFLTKIYRREKILFAT